MWLNSLTDEQKAALRWHWDFWARPNQKSPEGDWNTWVVLAGRGFGKTRMGSEWIREGVCGDTPLSAGPKSWGRVALVAETAADARDVMVLGESGILASHPKEFRPEWSPTNRCLTWPNGAKAWVYNATEPDQLRGPQHHCFTANTLISTPTGDVTVDKIKVGDYVLTRNGTRKVYDARSNISEVITVKFNNDTELTGTPDHLVLTENGWKSLQTLTTEDKLCVMNASNTAEKDGTITDGTTNTEEPVASTEKTETDYIEQFGEIITEKSLKDTISIIKTRIVEIIQSTTSNFLNTVNINGNIWRPIQSQYVTGQKKNPLKAPVEIAEKNSGANSKQVEVSFVQLVSNDEQTQKGHLDVVYNISVWDDPEYFANGILVHNCAWVDELAKFRYMQETWDQLQFGLRLGLHPQVLVTTTPRPLPLIKKLMGDADTVVTRGATMDNQSNLAANTVKQLYERYGGTRLGRQELEGEILNDIPGALWNREKIDENRKQLVPLDLERVLVAVDPAISNNEGSDEHGIIVVGLARDSDGYARGYVLEDGSLRGSPEEWAKRAVGLYRKWEADKIVAEKNQGGQMVESTIKTVDRAVSVKLVHASRGKVVRAEPISALYEQNRVHHVGNFNQLEDQMCLFSIDNIRNISNGSPDRVDALVWGLSELFDKITGRRKIADKPSGTIIKQSRQLPTGQGAWLAR